jgi:hypothetical protein
MESSTEILHLICDILEIREDKTVMVHSQRYEDAAKLRDSEKTLVTKVGKLMTLSGITENLDGLNSRDIESVIDSYLQNTYGVSWDKCDHTAKTLRRQLKLDELFKD